MGDLRRKRKDYVDTRNDAWQRSKRLWHVYAALTAVLVITMICSIIYIYQRAGSLWVNMPVETPGDMETVKKHLYVEDWDTEERASLWDAKGEPVPMPARDAVKDPEDSFERYLYYGDVKVEGPFTKLRVDANRQGKIVLVFDAREEADLVNYWYLRTIPFFGKVLIVETGGYFEGCHVLTAAIIVFFGTLMLATGYAAWALRRRALFGYPMVVNSGICLFSFVQLVIMIFYAFMYRDLPSFEFFRNLVSGIQFSAGIIGPIMLVAAIIVAISNIQLIRHEGFRGRNLLGILIAVCWMGALALFYYLGRDFAGSWEEVQRLIAMRTVLSAIMNYVFFLLVAIVLAAFLAQKHLPKYDKDYIIILGCHIRKDGTPTPILKGRIDRALAFERKQFKKTGKHAVFVPSGGQGSDEPTSEAEGMRQYLLSQGVPDERILLEDKSVNTFQNIRNSKKLILSANKDARVAFSTTNYHVFRSYVFLKDNNMYAEGMSAKTKAYFFPNAFLREFFGLLYAEKVPVFLVLVLIVLTYLKLVTLVM